MRLRIIALLALLAQILVGFQGAAPVAATPALNSVFFSDDFEAGTLGASWTTAKTGSGTFGLTSSYHQSGTQSALLSQNAAGAAKVSLILAFDLTGQTDVFLDFWTRATGGSPFGTARTVSISDNGGGTWLQIADLSATSQSFSHQVFDIAGTGRLLNSQFRIRFDYSDAGNGQISDGFVIDDVRLTQRAQELAPFPLAQDTFEAASFQQGIYPQSTNNGVAELSTDYHQSGVQSVFLGQNVAGSANASLELSLDLTGQTDVFLDFWARATGGYPFGTSRIVSISKDGGANWIDILDLSNTSQSFSHQVIDITSVAAAKVLTLNNQFRIRFNYSDAGNGKTSDGLVIDDLRLTQRAQLIASFPFGQESFESVDVQQGLYPQSTLAGVAEISKDYQHSGAKSMFLGQKVAGAASATLVMALDLTGQTDVLLDFWARATGGYPFGTSRIVSISQDGGANWFEILNLSNTSQSFSHQSLNVASLAADKGLVLNNQFRIRFYYSDTGNGKTSDGFVLDDIKLVRTSLSGKVYNEAATAGNEVAGAYVEVCSASNSCQTVTTTSDGSYGFGDLDSGNYTLRALPPANNTHLIGTLGPITLAAGTPLAGQNILLPKATGLPTGTTLTPSRGLVGGAPSIFWQTATVLSQKGCAGGTATYEVVSAGAVVRTGGLAETPAGTYSAQLDPFFPVHGTIAVSVSITCNTTIQNFNFNIWIDPSGLVVNTNGQPISGATVSLYSADALAGPYTLVANGSAVMSPSNRTNPMTSASNGAFGWDVIAGFYKVRAEKAGCTVPGGSQAYSETGALTIPPPVADLRIVLFCGEKQQLKVYLPLIRR